MMITAALVLAAPLTACASKETGSAQDSAPAASAPASPDASAASGQPSQQSTASPELGGPVGGKAITRGGADYKLSLYPLQRSGKSVLLTADLEITKLASSKDPDISILSNSKSTFSSIQGVPNGFALIDQAGEKMYLPALTDEKAGEDSALCSPSLDTKSVQGDVITVVCTFGGVPDDATQMTVKTDQFGSYANVPIK